MFFFINEQENKTKTYVHGFCITTCKIALQEFYSSSRKDIIVVGKLSTITIFTTKEKNIQTLILKNSHTQDLEQKEKKVANILSL